MIKSNLNLLILLFAAVGMVACSFSQLGQVHQQPETAKGTSTLETSGTEVASPDLIVEPETDDAIQPYPYTTPLPPPMVTILDGIYTKQAPFEGTPTPCRRCAPYRTEGGQWTLKLNKGVFRISHNGTGFEGIGSFTVSNNELVLFNDPNCHLESGIYTWKMDGRSLILKEELDTCAFNLRAKNLGAGAWLRQTTEGRIRIDPCQPPSLEAAVSGHWPEPEGCAPSK